MSPHPQPRPASPTPSRNKEPVKFSTLDHPPRANLLPPAALLSLLCLAFLCLVFVCFRHAAWIVKARKKMGKLIQQQATKLSDRVEEFIHRRHGGIKLIDDDQVAGPTSLSGSRVSLRAEPLQSLDLSHHHQLQSQLATVSRLQDDDQEEDEEDNEVLPPVSFSNK